MKEALNTATTLGHSQWEEIHHLESQRATLTNILMVIEAGSVGLVINNRYTLETLPACALAVICGIIGFTAIVKYGERLHFAQLRLTEIYKVIDRLCPELTLLNSLRKANMAHAADFSASRLSSRLHLSTIWKSVHILSILTGIALAIVVLWPFLREIFVKLHYFWPYLWPYL
jgi:hypothetical protein